MLKNHEVRFEVTNHCNAECIMCPREKMLRPKGIMNINLYKRLIDEIVPLGAKVVSLENYGEAFIDPFIFERAEYAKFKNLKTYTISNGSLLSPSVCSKIIAHFDKIRISLYGVTKNTYEKIHKGLSYEKTIDNLECLFALNSKKQTKIEIYFLLMKENEHEKDKFIELYKNKADAISVWKPHNWSNGRAYRNPPEGAKKMSCGRPMTGPLQIQWDGKAVPCCFDYDSNIILGDLNNSTIKELLNSNAYNNLRQAHISGNFIQYPFCNGCDQLYKRNDVLIYTNIKEAKVGATNTSYFNLKENTNEL